MSGGPPHTENESNVLNHPPTISARGIILSVEVTRPCLSAGLVSVDASDRIAVAMPDFVVAILPRSQIAGRQIKESRGRPIVAPA
jgi:hypothetical protein